MGDEGRFYPNWVTACGLRDSGQDPVWLRLPLVPNTVCYKVVKDSHQVSRASTHILHAVSLAKRW